LNLGPAMLAFVVLLSAIFGCESVMNKVLFTAQVSQQTGARCLDGTQSGYYFEPASAPANATNWVFFLQGGGACVTYADCKSRSTTALGSSNYWGPTYSDGNNVLCNNTSVNPAWATWNHVFVPYCGGDVHAGQQTQPWNGLYFAGYLTVRQVFNQLIQQNSFSKATNVLLSGESAGGIGTWVHANGLTDLLPNANVKAEPQGGWFFPNVTYYANWKNGTFVQLPDPTGQQLWDSYLDPTCVKDHASNPILCGSFDVAYSYIRTPLYISENKFDTNQIFDQLGCPQNASDTNAYIAYFGKGMRATVQKLLDSPKKDGIFLMSCLEHCSNTPLSSPTTIQGVRQRDSLVDWYYGTGKVAHQLVDNCAGDLPCNPTCV